MRLSEVISETEQLGCQIVFLDNYEEDGRFLTVKNQHFIFVNNNLDDIKKINVILHERSHLKHQDSQNSLSQVGTFQHHIEHRAEKDRITDFLNLVNTEYPLDDSFNYLQYMENAFINPIYENFVKEAAQKLYRENRNKE